jgi:hypothetical protein
MRSPLALRWRDASDPALVAQRFDAGSRQRIAALIDAF